MVADPVAFAAALPAEVTLADAGKTLVELQHALSQQVGPVVMLDAASLRVFDSSAVAVLLELRRQLRAQGKTLQVSNWPRRLESLMGLYGVSELLAP
ncbi:STAS domain protein [Hydrogenophaga sp. RAC07]|uniref:STAS domain-containing protein n=1 Tax=Hydrogenophaga sp. RAC07 TaxID=1842537 RepID=UPI00083D0EAB|nr:STAS domain-containing protein [Hydrogenophaga sp. RAC07]AOF86551.1 STAS domain protein [Hydrogenophaga sp. RAC07]